MSKSLHLLNRAIAFFACVLVLPCNLFGQTQNYRHLAVVSAYHESAPWVQDLFAEVTVHLSDQQNLWIDPTYMNATLITDQETLDRTIDGVFEHFKDKKPDFLLCFGGMTLLLRDRVEKEWGDIPIVLVSKSSVYGPSEYYFTSDNTLCSAADLHPIEDLISQYPNLTFIQYPDLYAPTVDMMMQMQPTIKKIIMLADASYNNRHIANETEEYLSQKYPQIEYEWLISKEKNVSRIHSLLTNPDPELGILLCSWYYGRIGTLGFPEILSGDISLMSAVKQPVFTLRESYIQDGAMGGYFPDFEQVSNSVVTAVRAMLNGDTKGATGHVFRNDLNAHPIVNYTQIQNTFLSKEHCPEGTLFINEPPSFWNQYKLQIIFGFILLLAAIAFISIRIRLQQRTIRFLNRYNILLENMPIGYTQAVILCNEKGMVTDIAYHSSNRSFAKILEDNAIPGKPDKIFPAPYIAMHVNNLLKECTTQVFTYHFDKTGRYISFVLCFAEADLKNRANPLKNARPEVELFAIDVTERSNAEKALHKITDKLELTLNLARIIPWVWDLRKHEITCDAHSIVRNIDPLSRHKFNFNTSISLHEDDFFERIHPDDKTMIHNFYTSLLQSEVSYVKTEFRVYPAANTTQKRMEWFEINATVVEKDSEGIPTMLAGSLLIITKRKKQEQALITAREQAQQSDRMKSAFLANMSHEIRTPLNAIVGFSGLLSKTDDPAKKTKYADLIESNNNLLLQLISDVLDLAKVESNTLEFFYQTVDLNELMQNIEQSIRFKVKEGVELKCSIGAPSCTINTDPNRLSQLINNLLTNSCKFTTQGSIEFGYEVKEQSLYFYVKDTGIGISFENQQKLFQRFSKLNNFAQGTGLGLSICKGIVETMGGCIGAVSAGEGKGSKFWFTIPFAPQEKPVEKGQKIEHTATAESNTDITVLVAEDNESNFLLFQSILEPEYKLVHAWDGVEAVDLFKKHNPQIILMDIGMPNMDGYEAAREIRKVSKTIPILAVTAFAFASDKERILSSGFDGYIAKPINADNLLNEVASALGKK